MHVSVSRSFLKINMFGFLEISSFVLSGSFFNFFIGVRLRESSPSAEHPLAFSGVDSSSFLCALPKGIFNPFSDLKLALEIESIWWSLSRYFFSIFCSSVWFFFSSSPSWVGLVTSSSSRNYCQSWNCLYHRRSWSWICDWQKARHFSIIEMSILNDQGHIKKV